MSKGITVMSIFDGVSCGYEALKRAGIPIDKYYASEIDKYADAISKYNFPDIVRLGDVKTFDVSKLPKIDILFAGFPCQSFSIAGNRKGFDDDRGNLFFDLMRIMKEVKPKYFLFENVASMKKSDRAKLDEIIGVKSVMINADLFVPQNRPRLYWTNIPIGNLPSRPNWDKKYYQWRRTYFRENKSGVCPCLTANMGTGGHNVPLNSMDLQDKLSCNELEKLQGFPEDFTKYGVKKGFENDFFKIDFDKFNYIHPNTISDFEKRVYKVSNTQRYKCIGNAWCIDVVQFILSKIFKYSHI